MTEEMGMDELLAQDVRTEPGAMITGTVVGVGDSVLINVGLKQEASVALREFGSQVPKVGDTIELLLIKAAGPEGRPVLSFRQARERKNWDKIAEAFQGGQILNGKITARIKGGVSVDIGLDAFMPASQIDLRPVGKPEEWVGRDVQVLVIEMDKAKGNVLVSRRKILEVEKAAKRDVTLQTLQVGQVVKGRVAGLTNFGAFVDIGGVEGLLHVSDLAWTRIDNPAKVLKVGDEIEVKVLKHDPASNRISLSRKLLLEHPWTGIETKYPVGGVMKGKVTGLADFGAFVQIEPGIEGLIHISELSWTDRVKRPHDVLKVGQEVEVRLLAIDKEKEKISLSLRRAGDNPWELAVRQFPVGTHVEGEVTHIVHFGAFVRIPLGIEALLKTQDLSWTERYNSPSQVLKVGDKVKAVVLEVNAKEEKMSLGLKQLTPDPLKAVRIGETIDVTVLKVLDSGIVVRSDNGSEGFIHSSEIFNQRSMFSDRAARRDEPQPEIPYKEGERIQASVIKVNRKDRKLELSVRKYERDQERQLLKKYSGNSGRPTLGDAIGWTDDMFSPRKKDGGK